MPVYIFCSLSKKICNVYLYLHLPIFILMTKAVQSRYRIEDTSERGLKSMSSLLWLGLMVTP